MADMKAWVRRVGGFGISLTIGLSMALLSGCAAKTQVRVSDRLFEANESEKIALIGMSKVNYPLMRGKGSALSVCESKDALTALLPQAKKVLTAKGYEVVYAEAAGVGYNCKGWWLMDDPNAPPKAAAPVAPKGEASAEAPGQGESEKAPELKQVSGPGPVYTYDALRSDARFGAAVESLLMDLETALSGRALDRFQPKPEDVKVIQEFTRADTICVNRVYGQKYSAARKAGDLAIGVAAALFGVITTSNTTNMVESFFLFIDRKGAVTWQHGVFAAGNPTSPSETFQESVLRYFPEKGKPIDRELCKPGAAGMASCAGG